MNTRAVAVIAALFSLLLPVVGAADPLHPIARDGYWHHDSNFIFPATLAGFTRVGAPQELNGSAVIVAYYAKGEGAERLVVDVWVYPATEGNPDDARYKTERNGWRIAVRAPTLSENSQFEGLIAALPVARLGEIDTRCPNPACGD